MDMGSIRGWFRLKPKTVEAARDACLTQGDLHHQAARQTDGKKADQERAAAEEYHAAAKDLRDGRYAGEVPNMRQCSDESIHGNNAPVQIVKGAKVEISERTLSVIAFALSVAAVTSVLWIAYGQTREIDRSREEQVRETNRLREEVIKYERESRVLQQQVMDHSALLMREGLSQPTDETNGPAGNLEYRRRRK